MSLVARVDDEKRRRNLGHRDESAEAAAQLLDLPIDHEAFALGVLLELARFALFLELQKAVDALADVLEIRERSADPASRDVRLAGALARRLRRVADASCLPPTKRTCLPEPETRCDERRAASRRFLVSSRSKMSVRSLVAEQERRGGWVPARARQPKCAPAS